MRNYVKLAIIVVGVLALGQNSVVPAMRDTETITGLVKVIKMYWKVSSFIDEDGKKQEIYNYFSIVKITNPKPPYYNGITKTHVFSQTKFLVVKAYSSNSEAEFVEWYHQNVEL